VIPLRRWAFPRPCGFSLTKCAGRSRLPARPLFEFYLLTEFCPAKPSRRPQPATPLLGFRSLRHMRAWRSTLHGLCLPATFRLQGLATLLTACSLQDRVGLFSCRRRPWDFPLRSFHLPEGIPRVSAGMNPHAVRHDACSQCETPSRNAGPQLLGFDPPGNSWRSAWV